MASGIYNAFKEDCFTKCLNLAASGDTIKVGLLNNSHSFSATDTTWSSVSANEISGTGYTAGGATLAGQTVTAGTSCKFDANDTAWTTATFTAYHAVLYDVTNTSSLIASFDFSGAQSVSAGTFTITWASGGIIYLS